MTIFNMFRNKLDPALVKQLNESPANRYSFVCSTMLNICNNQNVERYVHPCPCLGAAVSFYYMHIKCIHDEEQIINCYPIDGAMGHSGGGRVWKLSDVCLHNNAIVVRGILVTDIALWDTRTASAPPILLVLLEPHYVVVHFISHFRGCVEIFRSLEKNVWTLWYERLKVLVHRKGYEILWKFRFLKVDLF